MVEVTSFCLVEAIGMGYFPFHTEEWHEEDFTRHDVNAALNGSTSDMEMASAENARTEDGGTEDGTDGEHGAGRIEDGSNEMNAGRNNYSVEESPDDFGNNGGVVQNNGGDEGAGGHVNSLTASHLSNASDDADIRHGVRTLASESIKIHEEVVTYLKSFTQRTHNGRNDREWVYNSCVNNLSTN